MLKGYMLYIASVVQDDCMYTTDVSSMDCIYIVGRSLVTLTCTIADWSGVDDSNSRSIGTTGVKIGDMTVGRGPVRDIWDFLPKSESSNHLM